MMRGFAAVMVVALGIWLGTSVASPPETLILDALVNLYEPVKFSHGMHAEMAEDCTTCHHHGSADALHRSCKQCHESVFIYRYRGAERKTGLGLKGAYHTQCMGCHRENEAGPTGCLECHARRAKSSKVPSE